MKYPAFRIDSSPTPSTLLEVCDKCEKAYWTMDISNLVSYCSCGSRKRKATKSEIKEALLALRK